jgi:branched-chain amino acid transport system ATP-binding protein
MTAAVAQVQGAGVGTPLLAVRDLHVRYGGIRALHGVSLDVYAGEIVTLIGANGAGKTTLLRTISGLLRPAEGTITYQADATATKQSAATPQPDATRPASDTTLDYARASSAALAGLHQLRPHQIVRQGISHVPEGRQIFPNLSVHENLKLGAYQRHDNLSVDLERCHKLFPILKERESQKAGTLSGGEQQMLAIGRALMARPKLLLLDEPSLGLAPLIVRKIFDIIREINAEGTTVFLVEQNAHMALKIAHRAYVMQTGRVIMSDTAAKLLESPEVCKAYLGG